MSRLPFSPASGWIACCAKCTPTAACFLLNWLWCFGIVYSTIATRQHVLLDVIAGRSSGHRCGLHLAALRWYEQRATQTLARRAVERVRGA